MDGADAQGGGAVQGGALRLGALGRGDGVERGPADRVVRVAGQRLVTGRVDTGYEVQQGGGDDGGVHVDTAEVERAVAGGLVEFRAARGAPLGPAGGVPAVAEEHPVGGAAGGVGADEGEGLGEGTGRGEVQAGEGEAGGGGVDVGVGERGGDERPVEVDDLVDALREGVGGAFGADPRDVPPLDHHRRGEGVGGAVHLAAAEQDGAVGSGGGGGGGAVSHAPSFAGRPPPPGHGPLAGPQTPRDGAPRHRAVPRAPGTGPTAHTRGGRAS